MRPLAFTAAACLVLTSVSAAAFAQDRPMPSQIEAHCRQEVERLFPPGSLSRRHNERKRLIDACVANGGRMPG
jgi:hypothetical protein